MTLTVRFTFDDRFKVTAAKYFDPDFNLLSCELDNLVFKVFLKKFSLFLFAYSIKKNIVIFLSQSRFPAKLIDFRSASSACCLIKSIAIIL